MNKKFIPLPLASGKYFPVANLVFALALNLCLYGFSHGESTAAVLTLHKAVDAEVSIDGSLDEAIWQNRLTSTDMTVLKPDTLAVPRFQTFTRLFYTDKGLYVGIESKQPLETLLPRLSSRDKDISRDGTAIYLDTSGEGLYGFFFGVNLGGSLVDGTILPERQISRLWDGPWLGETLQTADGYSTEMYLPWSIMQMPDSEGERTMGFYVSRHVAHLDEEWGYPPLPDTKTRFLSDLQIFRLEDINTQQQLAAFPFTVVRLNNLNDETDFRLGTDLFWRPSSNLQVTASVNPDFGTVESDDVVVNLTAQETYFPEKRLFFLEGNEIFVTSPRAATQGPRATTGARPVSSSFFLEPTTLVNTRRIGGPARRPVLAEGVSVADVDLGSPSELKGAVKVTGQYQQLRYGVLAAFENDSEFSGSQALDDGSVAAVTAQQSGRDFGVVRLLYENTQTGRKSIGMISTLVAHEDSEASTHGIDAHYLNAKGNLFWDLQLMHSDVDGTKGYGAYVDVNFIPKRGQFHKLTLDYYDDSLDVSDFGFIWRNDVITARYLFNQSTSDHKTLRQLDNSLSLSYVTNNKHQSIRSSVFYRNSRTFHNKSKLNLIAMLRPPQWDDINSRGHGAYRYEKGLISEIAYGTDTSKVLSTSMGMMTMTEVFGDLSYVAKVGITYKPNDRLSLDVDFSYKWTTDWLIHLNGQTFATYSGEQWQPKVDMDIFLSAKQQIRFSLQWVGIKARAQDLYQVPLTDGHLIPLTHGLSTDAYDLTISRLTAQLRYRWELAPLSDLFVVYTRGSNIPNRGRDNFSNLFQDALAEPIIDSFVIKLRYRFGN